MDSSRYLKSYGWTEGEALQKGGLKKPILVKHKKDRKGIGHQPNGGADAWWERLFDGQLKALDVTSDSTNGELSFKQEKYVASGVAVSESPLYRMFVRGETLEATNGKVIITKTKVVSSNGVVSGDLSLIKTSFNESAIDGKKEKKEKRAKKEKKDKKDKKDKSEKKEKKGKTEKKDKKQKEAADKEVKEKKEKSSKNKSIKKEKGGKDDTRKSKKRRSDDSDEPSEKKKKKKSTI